MGQPYKPYSGKSFVEVTLSIADDIIQYVDWYCENGKYLPEEFAKNPAGWSEKLRSFQVTLDKLKKCGALSKEPDEFTYNEVKEIYLNLHHLFNL